jgi:hypothetical protein
MLMIRPHRRINISRATARMHRNVPVRLVASTSSLRSFHEHQKAVMDDTGIIDENVNRSELSTDATEEPPTDASSATSHWPANALTPCSRTREAVSRPASVRSR